MIFIDKSAVHSKNTIKSCIAYIKYFPALECSYSKKKDVSMNISARREKLNELNECVKNANWRMSNDYFIAIKNETKIC